MFLRASFSLHFPILVASLITCASKRDLISIHFSPSFATILLQATIISSLNDSNNLLSSFLPSVLFWSVLTAFKKWQSDHFTLLLRISFGFQLMVFCLKPKLHSGHLRFLVPACLSTIILGDFFLLLLCFSWKLFDCYPPKIHLPYNLIQGSIYILYFIDSKVFKIRMHLTVISGIWLFSHVDIKTCGHVIVWSTAPCFT